MKIDDLMNMTVKELLNKYCVVYSPECGHYYGIARWDDANIIFEEFDLEEEYCFSGDSLIPLDYGFDCGEEVLEMNTLRRLMNRLGIPKKELCPVCDSHKYHLDYNDFKMTCEDCGHKGEPKYVDVEENEEGGN